MTLLELQRGFRQSLLDHAIDAPELPASGLRVYRNNYRAQLIGCLRESYPLVQSLIGEDNFLAAATAHIDQHPPRAWTLDAYADGFGTTLHERFPQNPDVHEMAWIELALNTAFVANDARPLSAEDLAGVDWEIAQLRFSPSLCLSPATTNAAEIWWAMQEDQPPPDSEMLPQASGMLAWRRGYVCCLNTVDALEYDAMLHIQNNGSFSGLCALLVDRLGEHEGLARAGALLADWIRNELIVSIETKD